MAEFAVEFFLDAPLYVTIEADSPEEAKATVVENIEDDDDYLAQIVFESLRDNPPIDVDIYSFGTTLEVDA